MPETQVKRIVADVFGPNAVKELWTGNYEKVLPVTLQDFDIGAILPAVFYMFRFARRRGNGKFVATFSQPSGGNQRKSVTIEEVAGRLAEDTSFNGFDDVVGQAILGDLLLAYCLENKNRLEGRHQKIQKVTPTHFFASWVDLPDRVAHLRNVPETIVGLLSAQAGKEITLSSQGEKTWFPVGGRFDENVLLKAFAQGVRFSTIAGDRKGDRFDESEDVGIDQLLMVRIAQKIGQAPEEQRGTSGVISNQRPIATVAARHFSEDIRHFVRAYADVIPRHAFLELLESCIAVGLTTLFTSTVEAVFHWAEHGRLPENHEQRPAELLVDCSNGIDLELRDEAERSMADFVRRVERFPVILMALRILDWHAKNDREIRRKPISTSPDATEWINLLGDILTGEHARASWIHEFIETKVSELAEKLDGDYPNEANQLRDDIRQPNPVWRLAEVLIALMGRTITSEHVYKFLGSAMFVNRPNGLAASRKVLRAVIGENRKRQTDLRRLVFTDAVLDYLVHLHLLDPGANLRYRSLSLKRFLQILEERYGFYVEHAPPGLSVSNELLHRNRQSLERRLRDLGLFVGVNDAEAMKHLRPRFDRNGGPT